MREPKEIAVHLRVGGRVQGVGFRYHVLRAARSEGLAGWVRNLPDGDVEVVVEGPAEAVDALIGVVRSGPPMSRVERLDVRRGEASGRFDRFDVRY